jgi:hypothetical protein
VAGSAGTGAGSLDRVGLDPDRGSAQVPFYGSTRLDAQRPEMTTAMRLAGVQAREWLTPSLSTPIEPR